MFLDPIKHMLRVFLNRRKSMSLWTTLSDVLDKHAPLIIKTITVRPCVPWFSDEIKTAKQLCRKRERVWRRTRLSSDKELFVKARNRTVHLINQARRNYYKTLIDNNSDNQKKLFKAASTLLGGSSDEQYPPHNDSVSMANEFGQFFIRKIENIHLKLDSLQTLDEGELSQPSFSGTLFTVFQPVLTDDIEKLVMKAPSKTCDNDPVPTQVVKACINELLPSISNIVNSSLSSALSLISGRRPW